MLGFNIQNLIKGRHDASLEPYHFKDFNTEKIA